MSMTLVRNLYPNPLFNSRGALHTLSGGSGTITCIDSRRQLGLRSNGEQGMQASLALTGLPASTSMVFQFSFWTSYKSLRNGCLCIIGSSLSSGWSELARGGHPQADGIHDTVTIEFTTPQNTNGIQIVFNSAMKTGADTVFDRPTLMTKTDWDWWQRNKPAGKLLSGDLMPLS